MEEIDICDNGRWFPVLNAAFDIIMPRLSPGAWKVLCVVIRQTWGWKAEGSKNGRSRKLWDHIPYSQFRQKSGIASDATVKRCIDECLEHGSLLRRQVIESDGNPRLVRGKPYYEYAVDLACLWTATETVEVSAGTSTESVAVTATRTVELGEAMATESVEPKQQFKKTTDKHRDPVEPSSDLEREAYEALRDLGIHPAALARRYAQEEPANAIGWVNYAQQQDLDNPAGYVRKQLDEDEPAPDGQLVTASPPRAPGGVFR